MVIQREATLSPPAGRPWCPSPHLLRQLTCTGLLRPPAGPTADHAGHHPAQHHGVTSHSLPSPITTPCWEHDTSVRHQLVHQLARYGSSLTETGVRAARCRRSPDGSGRSSRLRAAAAAARVPALAHAPRAPPPPPPPVHPPARPTEGAAFRSSGMRCTAGSAITWAARERGRGREGQGGREERKNDRRWEDCQGTRGRGEGWQGDESE